MLSVLSRRWDLSSPLLRGFPDLSSSSLVLRIFVLVTWIHSGVVGYVFYTFSARALRFLALKHMASICFVRPYNMNASHFRRGSNREGV